VSWIEKEEDSDGEEGVVGELVEDELDKISLMKQGCNGYITFKWPVKVLTHLPAIHKKKSTDF
jgi:hypothetical protein